MRTTVAARYARWSAAMAVLLAIAVAGVYGSRSWQSHEARKAIPPAVPSTIEQSSAGFSFSKVTGNRTEFKVRASRATEFTEGGRTLLEDVWITSYGADNQRFDNLHTHSCDYIAASGLISCAGEVQIDLQSANDTRAHPGSPEQPDPQHSFHATTTHLAFNYQTGIAETDQPLTFHFPQGEGQAVGFRYEAKKGELQLLKDVEITLHQAGGPSDTENQAAQQALQIKASSVDYDRDNHLLQLMGPVQAQQGRFELDAGKVDVDLDADLHPQRITATEQPELRDTGPANLSVKSEKIYALASPLRIERIIAEGQVDARSRSFAGEDQLLAEKMETELDAKSNQPRRLTATGNVVGRSKRSGGSMRSLNTSVLKLEFAVPQPSGELRVQQAITPAAKVEWQGPALSAGETVTEHTVLTGQRLEGFFGGENELQELRGFDGVQLERQIGAGPTQISTSREFDAHFAQTGEWSIIDQSGDVHLRQNDQSAQAERAHFDRANDTAKMDRSVVLTDASSRTTAQSAILHQNSNELRAYGRVATSEIPSGDAQYVNLSPGPGRISADELKADTATGHAIYSGGARLWQGDSIVEAQTIELDRHTHVLTAVGRVRAIFPQEQWMPAGTEPSPAPQPSKTEYWRAEGGRLIYASNENRGRMEEKVHAYSEQGSVHSDAMDLFFAPTDASVAAPKAGAPAGGAAWGASIGGRQLVRANASGNVAVEQQGRHGTSTQAAYTAQEGKFVLSGGNPTAYDESGNTTRGRQLTFLFGDDSINVDSAEGLRTVTLHRVEK